MSWADQPVFLQGGVARLSDGTIAGSATNVYDCMLRAISFGIPREDASAPRPITPPGSLAAWTRSAPSATASRRIS